MSADPRDARIADLEAENARLRAELGAIRRHRSSYTGRRENAIARGTWQPFADSRAVRAHIQAVIDTTGITTDSYAKLAGVDWMTVNGVMSGTRDQVRTSTAEKLTAVTAGTVLASDHARVDAAGTRRRLRALAVRGWSLSEISRRSGADCQILAAVRDGRKTRIAAATHRKVAAVYGLLLVTGPPQGTREEKTAAGRSRSAAARNGWESGWAWDDDTIDDPAARPIEGWQRDRRLTGAGLAAEARELASFGLTREQAAERLGVSLDALEKTLSRHPEAAEGDEAA